MNRCGRSKRFILLKKIINLFRSFFFSDDMQILIKTMDHSVISIAVNPSDSIRNVKKKIHKECPPDKLRLVFAGKKLEDDRTLNHYNVQNESILHLVQRLRIA